MSTKIYNAYKFNGSIEDLMVFLWDLKKKYWENVEYVFKGSMVWDYYFVNMDRLKAIDEFEKGMRKGTRFNYYDPSASVVVYFYKKHIYVQFFGVFEDLYKLDESKILDHRFKDYHYQNSTEGPDDVSQRSWNTRKRTWDEIMSHGGSFRENGLTFDVFCENDAFSFVWKLKEELLKKRKKNECKD